MIVKPVIDTAEIITSRSYAASDRLRDQVVAINPTCVFPYCDRPADHLDLDHIEPYEPYGPPGQTNTTNLAGLCRCHHRLKTHGGWAYTHLTTGEHLWSSPHGHHWHTGPTGTTAVFTGPPPRQANPVSAAMAASAR